MDTKTRTIIECSCGKQFINISDIPWIFEKGQIIGNFKHFIKQIYYNLKFTIHSLLCRHKLKRKYKTVADMKLWEIKKQDSK